FDGGDRDADAGRAALRAGPRARRGRGRRPRARPGARRPERRAARVGRAPPPRGGRWAGGARRRPPLVGRRVLRRLDPARPRRDRAHRARAGVDKILIEGGRRLEGRVRVSGAKNATLPLMCAALLADTPVTLRNVPDLMDVRTTAKLLRTMGVGVAIEDDTAVIDAARITSPEAPYELVKTMRASILVLGP